MVQRAMIPIPLINTPCDIIVQGIQQFIVEALRYTIEGSPHIRTWGMVDHALKVVFIQTGIPPAAAILTLTHEVGHILLTPQNEVHVKEAMDINEARAEAFADIATAAIGFEFAERCRVMAAFYVLEAGIDVAAQERFLSEITGTIAISAVSFIRWIESCIEEGRVDVDNKRYDASACPRWRGSEALFHIRYDGKTDHRFKRRIGGAVDCHPESCSRHPGVSGGPPTRNHYIQIPRPTRDPRDKPTGSP